MQWFLRCCLYNNYNYLFTLFQVLWEPFLEPWKFQVSLRREHRKSALENSAVMTDVHLESRMNLNVNVTESFIEVVKIYYFMFLDVFYVDIHGIL